MPGVRLRELLRQIDLKVVVSAEDVDASVDTHKLAAFMKVASAGDPASRARLILPLGRMSKRRSHEVRVVLDNGITEKPFVRDGRLLELILKAHDARRELAIDGVGAPDDNRTKHLSRLARLTFLAPDIITSISEGTQPKGLSARRLLRTSQLPIAWSEQRSVLGYR
jgi:site-specific DNA recombinase